MAALSPELMAPEERVERAAELESEIARQWVRYAITEAAVLWLPLGLLVVAYVLTDAIEDSTLPVIVGIWLAASLGLTTYWVVARIRPRQRELAVLRGGDG
jgi:hypothetical protein